MRGFWRRWRKEVAVVPATSLNQFIEQRPRNVSIGLVTNYPNKDLIMTTITELAFANESAGMLRATPNQAARRSPVIG